MRHKYWIWFDANGRVIAVQQQKLMRHASITTTTNHILYGRGDALSREKSATITVR